MCIILVEKSTTWTRQKEEKNLKSSEENVKKGECYTHKFFFGGGRVTKVLKICKTFSFLPFFLFFQKDFFVRLEMKTVIWIFFLFLFSFSTQDKNPL